MDKRRIKIFSAGTHRNAGAKKVWTAQDVRKIYAATVARPETAIDFVPLHPKNDLPVFGRADKSTLEITPDGSLYITPTAFAEEFIPALKEAGFVRVSIGLREDFSIRHIGLVDDPAVADAGHIFQASAELAHRIDFEFSENLTQTQMTDVEKRTLEDAAQSEKRKAEQAEAEKKALEVRLAEAEKLKVEAEKKVADAEARTEAAALETEIATFCASKEVAGIVTPKNERAIKAVMRSLSAKSAKGEYEFKTDDGKNVKTTALEDFKAFIKSLPKLFTGKEVATEGTSFMGADGKPYDGKKKKAPSRDALKAALMPKEPAGQ